MGIVKQAIEKEGYAYSRDSEVIVHAIAHICDWITVGLKDGAPWTRRRNADGVPLKLAKCHSMKRLVHEADKAMRLLLQRNGAVGDRSGEEVVERLEEGFALVRMTDPEALRAEGASMQHCIGLGAYDDRIGVPGVEFLSLRDRMNKPHVTIEVVDGILKQIKGKQNADPATRYAALLAPAFRRRGYRSSLRASGLIESETGEMYSIFDMPKGLRVGSVWIEGVAELERLPEDMTSSGHVAVQRSGLRAVPDGFRSDSDLIVDGNPFLSRIGSGVVVGGGLHIGGSALKSLPADLVVRGPLYASADDFTGNPEPVFCVALEEIPSTVHVGGDLCLDGSRSLKKLPDDFVFRASLNLNRTSIERLPDPLNVPDTLFLVGCADLQAMPMDMSVGGDLRLDLRGFGLLLRATENGHRLSVGGTVYVDNHPVVVSLEKPAWCRPKPAAAGFVD